MEIELAKLQAVYHLLQIELTRRLRNFKFEHRRMQVLRIDCLLVQTCNEFMVAKQISDYF